MSNSLQGVAGPRAARGGGVTAPFDEPVPDKERSTYDELRFRPPDEPKEGGYSLRVKTVNDPHVSSGLDGRRSSLAGGCARRTTT